jgi:hypothetical protein
MCLQSSIFTCPPDIKLDLLLLMADQLLTYFKFREKIDSRVELAASLKRDLRQARQWDAQQEKEAANAR